MRRPASFEGAPTYSGGCAGQCCPPLLGLREQRPGSSTLAEECLFGLVSEVSALGCVQKLGQQEPRAVPTRGVGQCNEANWA